MHVTKGKVSGLLGKRVPLGKKKVPTKMDYERHLDDCAPEQGSEEWIIGGKIRMFHMATGKYGRALREYDPIAFMVGYNEFKLENR